MHRYAVYGASGFGREVMPLLRRQLQSMSKDWDLVFVDDRPPARIVNGHRVLSYGEWLAEPADGRSVTVAIADGHARATVADRCQADGVEFVEIRAPNVFTMDDAQWGVGAVLTPFVTVTSNVRIGRHFHANLYSYVAHDCVIGDYVTFAPSVCCNGNVVIEDYAYIGTAAILRQGKPGQPLVIGAGATVGMGAVVTKSVEPGAVVVGNPARPMVRAGT